MKLFKHQKEALERVTDNDQFALFMEVKYRDKIIQTSKSNARFVDKL